MLRLFMMNHRTIWLCSLGTLIEWAEFSYYAYLLALFSQLFFANTYSAFAMMAALFGFAISYMARPLGAVFFGWIGDSLGRRVALVFSLGLMGMVTFTMGLLPTYTSIGISASLLLLSLRFLQGFAIAGEFTGAAIYLVEKHADRPYLSSSFISTFSALGMFLGALLAWVVSLPSMPDWAWRAPFLIGGLSCLLALYMRLHLTESLILVKKRTFLFRQHKRAFFKALSLATFVGIYIYTCNVWWVSYSTEHSYFTAEASRRLGMIAQAAVVCFTPLVALYAEKRGNDSTLYWGVLAAIPFSLLLFWVTQQASFVEMLGLMLVYALINASVTAVMFKWMADLFPPNVRYSCVALAWNIAVALFASISPMVAQWLSQQTNTPWLCASYVVLSALIALLMIKENKKCLKK